METQFTSPFWHYYIIAVVVMSFIYIIWLLLAQNRAAKRRPGEEVKTMGHSWDGIEEYDNPLPRWWFWMFIATIAFGVAYLFAYPGLGDYKGRKFDDGTYWSSKNQYDREMREAEQSYAQRYGKYAAMTPEEASKHPEAMELGKNLFDVYCIQCHGSDAKGSRGFPNLTDTDWLYGGTPDKIHETIAKGRIGIMAPWGPTLGEERVKDAANYVMSLSGKEHNEDRAARGKEVFAANCAVCHGPEGQGVQGTAPNLTDDVWLWGGSEKAIIETITGGRHNQMPAWEGFLSKEKLHLLTTYVWGKSHPDGNALPTDTKNAAGKQAAKAEDKAKAEPASAQAASASAAKAAEAAKMAAPAEDKAIADKIAADKAAAEQAAASAEAAKAAAPAANEAAVTVENGVIKFYFATGKSDVAAGADKAAADAVKAAKAGKKLVVSGFADSTGNAAANARLSKQRAQAVQAFLLKQGVKAESIELRKPASSMGGKGNNAEGRRVEVKIEG